MDEGPRADTSLEALLALKPAFHVKGTVTAGNSSQMSDGAAAAVVMSGERAKALGIKPLARYVSFATAGVQAGRNGNWPGVRNSESFEDGRAETFRHRRVRVERSLRRPITRRDQRGGDRPGRVNPNGGAIALGHPLGCTGAKLTARIIRELKRRNGRYGMVTMCAGAGWARLGYLKTLGNVWHSESNTLLPVFSLTIDETCVPCDGICS